MTPLAALIPGPVPVPGPNEPVGTSQESPSTEALSNCVALFQMVGSQEALYIRLAVGLGPFVAELLVGVPPVPFEDVGRLGLHAHNGPTPFLRVAKLPLVLDVNTEAPKGHFKDHA